MFDTMSGFEMVLWCLAVPASVLFAIQTILTFVGASVDHSFDAPSHDIPGNDTHSGFSLAHFPVLTVRNFITFFMMLGWVGIAMVHGHAPSLVQRMVATAVGSVVGLIMVIVTSLMFYWISKLASTGNVSINDSLIGSTGNVYLEILGNRAEAGKVTIKVNEKLIECKAMTEGVTIPTGATVKVIKVEDGILIVEKF